MHCAGTALREAAAEVGIVEAQVATQRIKQRHLGLRVHGYALTVDGELVLRHCSSSSGNFQDDLTLAVRRFYRGVSLVCFLELKAPCKLRLESTLDHPVEDFGQPLARSLDGRPLHSHARWNRMRREGRGRKRDQYAAGLQRLQRLQM